MITDYVLIRGHFQAYRIMRQSRITSTAAAKYMCSHASPAKLNNIYGISNVATIIFVTRFRK